MYIKRCMLWKHKEKCIAIVNKTGNYFLFLWRQLHKSKNNNSALKSNGRETWKYYKVFFDLFVNFNYNKAQVQWNHSFFVIKCKVWWQNSDMQVKNSKSGFHHLKIGSHNIDRGSRIITSNLFVQSKFIFSF